MGADPFQPENNQPLTMIFKWGFEGSSSHSSYKQNFSDNSESTSDSISFMRSCVSLQLFYCTKEEKTIWFIDSHFWKLNTYLKSFSGQTIARHDY